MRALALNYSQFNVDFEVVIVPFFPVIHHNFTH